MSEQNTQVKKTPAKKAEPKKTGACHECKYAVQVEERVYRCTNKNYDIKNYSCFE